jgi:LuxR family maltose regulon positive regulatory protein
MPGVRGAAPGDAPAYVVATPVPPEHAIRRPELTAHLNRIVDAHQLTLVVAPAGYGKTTALSAWAAQSRRPVAWLSLTALDKHPQRLERGLLTALESIHGTGAVDLVDLMHRHLGESVLIVDDVHLLGAATAGVLGLLVEQAPTSLRVVLASRQRPLLRLQRVHAAGGLGVVVADQLSFTATEIGSAAAQLHRPLAPRQADNLLALTAGWPVAVRLALLSGPDQVARLATGGQLRLTTLTDYLLEEVLADLPSVLRDFLLTISVSDWMTPGLATELSGDPMAPALVEDAIARGIPIERRGSLHGDPVYRWHPLVADQCRVLLRRKDPVRARRLHLRCADLLVGVDEVLAARHALAGQSPRCATEPRPACDVAAPPR